MNDPVGIAEIAERLGVKPGTVAQWKRRGKLPEPKPFKVSGYDVWEWRDINRWATTTGHPIRHHVVVDNYISINEYGEALGVSADEAEQRMHQIVNTNAGKIRWHRGPAVVPCGQGGFGWYGMGENISQRDWDSPT